MNDSISITPIFKSKWGFHPFSLSTLKKLREINKYYYWRLDLIRSIQHKEFKLPHNRFTYTKTSDGVVKTPWARPETPEVPDVRDIIEEGRHGKGNLEAVRPVRYTNDEIDVILEEARRNYAK